MKKVLMVTVLVLTLVTSACSPEEAEASVDAWIYAIHHTNEGEMVMGEPSVRRTVVVR